MMVGVPTSPLLVIDDTSMKCVWDMTVNSSSELTLNRLTHLL